MLRAKIQNVKGGLSSDSVHIFFILTPIQLAAGFCIDLFRPPMTKRREGGHGQVHDVTTLLLRRDTFYAHQNLPA